MNIRKVNQCTQVSKLTEPWKILEKFLWCEVEIQIPLIYLTTFVNQTYLLKWCGHSQVYVNYLKHVWSVQLTKRIRTYYKQRMPYSIHLTYQVLTMLMNGGLPTTFVSQHFEYVCPSVSKYTWIIITMAGNYTWPFIHWWHTYTVWQAGEWLIFIYNNY